MTTGTIIQARMGSTRLPGKVLLSIGERTVLERVVERVRGVASAGEVVVATSDLGDDDAIEELCAELGVRCVRGSEADVLDRFLVAARAFDLDLVLRVTADSPLVAPELLDEVVRIHRERSADYAWIDGAPSGLTGETLSFRALEAAASRATLPADREHVITYVVERADEFVIEIEPAVGALARPELRLTLDDEHDLQLIRALYDRSGGELFQLDALQIVALVDAEHAERRS